MLKEINDYLAGVPATIVAGFFLLLHLLPSFFGNPSGSLRHLNILPFDPA